MLENEPAFVKQVLSDMLEQSRTMKLGECIANTSVQEGMAEDIRAESLRSLLTQVIRKSADKAIKTIAVRLLLRLGYIFGSSRDCLLAAEL